MVMHLQDPEHSTGWGDCVGGFLRLYWGFISMLKINAMRAYIP